MNESNDKKPSLWAEAIKIMSQVSYWVVGPIVLALIFGKMLDSHYGTKPWIFIGLTALAFGISVYGIFKVMKEYMDNLKLNGDK